MTGVELLERCAGCATFILSAAFLAGWALRRASAAWRHFLWTAVLGGLLMLPAMVRLTPKWGIETAPAVTAVDQVTVAESVPGTAPAPRRDWNPVLLVWLAGFAAFGVRLAVGRRHAGRIVDCASDADYARSLMEEVGGAGARVLESPLATTALAIGIFRPVVVLPAGAREWPAGRLRAALLHEWMHVRRRDLAAQAVSQLAVCLYWFHPLAWLAARQLRREREHACDDAVLARGLTAHDYAGHLVESVRALRALRPDVMAMAEPSLLEVRIQALLDSRRDRRPLNRAAALGIVTVLAMVLLPLAAVNVHAQAAPTPAPAAVATPASDPAPQAPATGSLSGTVTDPSGARVPGCRIKASNLNGSNEEVTTADPAGAFSFASIPEGQYALQISVPGFKALTLKAIAVSASHASVVNARLVLGDVSEAFTVQAARPSGAPAAAAQAAPNRIRVGGMVKPAMLLYKAAPSYPDDLKAKGVTGTVHLAGIITKQGYLQDLRVLNTDVDAAFASAAMEAAAHWLYQPSTLNGEPVAVMTNIDITFELVQ